MAPSPIGLWDQGSRLLNKVTGFHAEEKPKPPAISERTALLCAVLYTLLYVAPFYISPTLRATPLTGRDAPSVIQARVRAVILTCITCTLTSTCILVIYGEATPYEVLRLLGLWPVAAINCAKVLGLVAVLFVGPLYEVFVVDGDWRSLGLTSIKETIWNSWTGYRNIVVAPISEEFVFRSLTIALYLLAKVSATRIVFLTPLIFGIAHVHHLVEFLKARTPVGRRTPPLNAWLMGIARSFFQFTYTSLFGFFAAFVFLRTGSLWAAILAHAFCNSMGFPRVWGRLGEYYAPAEQVTPDVAQGKRDDDAELSVKVGNGSMLTQDDDVKGPGMVQTRLSLAWTVIYYVLLLVGAYGFYTLLWSLTESENALASFD